MKKSHYIFSVILFLTTVLACEDDDQDFSLVPSLGFAAAEGTVVEGGAIKIGFYANTTYTEPVTVTVALRNFQDLVYGTDYVMDPVPDNGVVTVTLDPEDPAVLSFYPIETGVSRRINFEITKVEGGGLALAQQTALTYALTIRAADDVEPGAPLPITHNFDDCTTDFATPAGFIEVFEPESKEDRGWGCRAFGVDASRAPRASAFGGAAGEDKAWMIMDPVQVPAGTTVRIKFSTYSAFSGPGSVHVKWSSDYTGSGNPLLAHWEPLASLDAQFPAAGSQAWTDVEGTFAEIEGPRIYFAFQYIEGTSAASSAYDIDNLSITAE